MTYELTILEKPTYLHVRVTGTNSAETVMAYLKEVATLCSQRNYAAVLIEENLAGPGLKLVEIFSVASTGSGRLPPNLRRIAYVDVNDEHSLADMKFAETVAVNRGVGVRVFARVEDAEAWLHSGKVE